MLLVSDGPGMRDSWVYALRQKGVDVIVADSAAEALGCWAEGTFDLVAIDVCTSQLDGVGLCRQLRPEAANPILLFIPSASDSRILEAYQAGVDECVVKPISPSLFLAKARAWLRHSWTLPSEALDGLRIGDVALDPARREVVTSTRRAVRLTNLEFRLLHLLMTHRGQALAPGVIIGRVWGYADGGDNTALKNVIYRLRRKIEPDPANTRYIQTVPGEGYLFQPW